MILGQTILITGGCGFIGTSLISQLVKKNPEIQIIVMDNFITGSPKDLSEVTDFTEVSESQIPKHKGVFLVQGDVRNAHAVMHCAKRANCIVHLAANTGVASSVQNPKLDMEVNVIGTVNTLEAARINKVQKFIFASSGAPAGEVAPPIHEELPPHPVSPYGASKLSGEGYCSAYYRTYGVDTVCLRFGNVYGPRSKKKYSVVAKFIRETLAGDPCMIYGDGKQTRDFLFIDDLVRAVSLCIEKKVNGEIFQIATGTERTIGEVAKKISSIFSKRGIKMEIVYGEPRLGDVKRNFADNSKAKEKLGWNPKMEFEQGIELTIDYFVSLLKT